MLRFRTQDVGGHHRRDQAGDDQREEHGNRRRPAELAEELADDAAHEGGRQEDADQGEGRGNHRQTDFVRRFHCRIVGRFAAAQVADDVFDFDDSIVHQHADNQRQRQQRDDIQGKAQQPHDEEGGDDRQRQGDGSNQRRAPVAQEDKDDEDSEQPAFQQHIERTVIIVLDRRGAVIDLGDRHLRIIRLNTGEFRFDCVGDPNLTRAPAAGDGESDHRLTVVERQRIRLRRTIADGGEIAQAVSTARRADLQLGQRGRIRQRSQRADRLLAVADLRLTARRIALQREQLLLQFRHRQPQPL